MNPTDQAQAMLSAFGSVGATAFEITLKTLKGKKLWIITEADRSVTTLLLPDDY